MDNDVRTQVDETNQLLKAFIAGQTQRNEDWERRIEPLFVRLENIASVVNDILERVRDPKPVPPPVLPTPPQSSTPHVENAPHADDSDDLDMDLTYPTDPLFDQSVPVIDHEEEEEEVTVAADHVLTTENTAEQDVDTDESDEEIDQLADDDDPFEPDVDFECALAAPAGPAISVPLSPTAPPASQPPAPPTPYKASPPFIPRPSTPPEVDAPYTNLASTSQPVAANDGGKRVEIIDLTLLDSSEDEGGMLGAADDEDGKDDDVSVLGAAMDVDEIDKPKDAELESGNNTESHNTPAQATTVHPSNTAATNASDNEKLARENEGARQAEPTGPPPCTPGRPAAHAERISSAQPQPKPTPSHIHSQNTSYTLAKSSATRRRAASPTSPIPFPFSQSTPGHLRKFFSGLNHNEVRDLAGEAAAQPIEQATTENKSNADELEKPAEKVSAAADAISEEVETLLKARALGKRKSKPPSLPSSTSTSPSASASAHPAHSTPKIPTSNRNAIVPSADNMPSLSGPSPTSPIGKTTRATASTSTPSLAPAPATPICSSTSMFLSASTSTSAPTTITPPRAQTSSPSKSKSKSKRISPSKARSTFAPRSKQTAPVPDPDAPSLHHYAECQEEEGDGEKALHLRVGSTSGVDGSARASGPTALQVSSTQKPVTRSSPQTALTNGTNNAGDQPGRRDTGAANAHGNNSASTGAVEGEYTPVTSSRIRKERQRIGQPSTKDQEHRGRSTSVLNPDDDDDDDEADSDSSTELIRPPPRLAHTPAHKSSRSRPTSSTSAEHAPASASVGMHMPPPPSISKCASAPQLVGAAGGGDSSSSRGVGLKQNALARTSSLSIADRMRKEALEQDAVRLRLASSKAPPGVMGMGMGMTVTGPGGKPISKAATRIKKRKAPPTTTPGATGPVEGSSPAKKARMVS